MTPSNTPITPQINNIADNRGDKHTVVPSDHTHTQSEVTGLTGRLTSLENDLADKADKNHKHSSIQLTSGYQIGIVRVVKNETTNKVDVEVTFQDLADPEYERKAVVNWDTIANLQRAMDNPDSTPTSNSDNLVTSGGVAGALAGKQNTLTFDDAPTANSNNPVKSSGIKTALNGKADATHTHTALDVQGLIPSFLTFDGGTFDLDGLITTEEGLARVCIQNSTSGHVTFDDLFYSGDAVPVHVNINGSVHIDPNYYVIATIYKIDKNLAPDHEHELCYFIEINGIFNDGN